MLRLKDIESRSEACRFLRERSETYRTKRDEQEKIQTTEMPESAWLISDFHQKFAIPKGYIGFHHDEIPTFGK